MYRRSFLASLGAVVGAGCTTKAQGGDQLPTETPAETSERTTTATPTERPNEVTEIALPTEVSVGEPVPVAVTMTNPGEGAEWYYWSYSVFDVEAAAMFTRTVNFQFKDGDAELTEEFVVKWGTDHATTLFFDFDGSSIVLPGTDGVEEDYERTVQVVE